MHVFLLASGAILCVASATLSVVLGSVVRKQANADVRADLSHVTRIVLSPKQAGNLLVDPALVSATEHRLMLDPNVSQVEIVQEGQRPHFTTGQGQIVFQQPLLSSDGKR